MKTRMRTNFSKLTIMVLILVLFNGCKKEEDDIAPIEFNPAVAYGTMTDQDGNVYRTVTIGTQEWMAENLRTTKYRNGDHISMLDGESKWKNAISGACCCYDNEMRYIAVYGLLYNHYAVSDSRDLAPEGWHVATNHDWEFLFGHLGGIGVAGQKLKEQGPGHWHGSNEGTNESGFTALPGGYRFQWQIITNGSWDYGSIGTDGMWWTADGGVWISSSLTELYEIDSGLGLKYGRSVRCVRDQVSSELPE